MQAGTPVRSRFQRSKHMAEQSAPVSPWRHRVPVRVRQGLKPLRRHIVWNRGAYLESEQRTGGGMFDVQGRVRKKGRLAVEANGDNR